MAKSPGSTPEPDRSHNGLNVVDFPDPSILGAINKSISMLNPGKRRLLYIVAGIQISLGILDLIGIALIGLLAAVAVSGIGVNDLPDWVTNGFDQLGLGAFTVSQLSILLALVAVIILISKTVISAFLGRRIIRFLANRQADLSARTRIPWATLEFCSTLDNIRGNLCLRQWRERSYGCAAGFINHDCFGIFLVQHYRYNSTYL